MAMALLHLCSEADRIVSGAHENFPENDTGNAALTLTSEANSSSRPAGGGGEECGAELRVGGLMGDESRATREPGELLAALIAFENTQCRTQQGGKRYCRAPNFPITSCDTV
uniref:Uncharacterized protein n=1 Tax=Oryza glumipatula TaxID=40148 RepID=A0A0D9ZUY9_9ORYZ